MVNINPNRESCMEYMKELIRKGLTRSEIVKECRKHFKGVDKHTFYDWYKIVIKEQDIKAWEVYLEQVIQPVQKGTKASVMWVPEGQIVFNYEGFPTSTIENEDFARAFLNIWLGEKTSRPKLRSQLLGDS